MELNAFAFETLTIAGSATTCTSATYQPASGPPASRAILGPLEAGQIRWRADGTAPTASVGHLMEVGDPLILEGLVTINKFQAIRTGAVSGSLPVTYER